MYEVKKNSGLSADSKVRRTAIEPEDLFRSYIIGMDSYAIKFKIVNQLIEDKVL